MDNYSPIHHSSILNCFVILQLCATRVLCTGAAQQNSYPNNDIHINIPQHNFIHYNNNNYYIYMCRYGQLTSYANNNSRKGQDAPHLHNIIIIKYQFLEKTQPRKDVTAMNRVLGQSQAKSVAHYIW